MALGEQMFCEVLNVSELTRKVHANSGSLCTVLPADLCAMVGIEKGDRLRFEMLGRDRLAIEVVREAESEAD